MIGRFFSQSSFFLSVSLPLFFCEQVESISAFPRSLRKRFLPSLLRSFGSPPVWSRYHSSTRVPKPKCGPVRLLCQRSGSRFSRSRLFPPTYRSRREGEGRVGCLADAPRTTHVGSERAKPRKERR